jgi:chromosome segregation ATPase
MKRKPKTTEFNYSPKDKDLPATQGMLWLVRSELRADYRGIRSETSAGFKQVDSKHSQFDARFKEIDARFNEVDARFNEVDARFKEVDARFDRVDARFDQMEARFNQIDARFDTMDSKFERVLSEISRIGLIVEEQNARNRVVMEGLTGLWQRQDRVEKRVDLVEETVQSISKPRV